MTSSFSMHLRLAGLVLLAGALLLPVAPVRAGALDWQPATGLRGSGSIVKQSRSLPAFNGVSLSMGGQVTLKLGDSEDVTLETDDNILPAVETVVEDGVLHIRPQKDHGNLAPTRLNVVVNARTIERLRVGGSGAIGSDTLRTPRLRADIGGSGSINIEQLHSELVSVGLGGSGSFRAGGSAQRLTVAIGGSGNVQTGQLAANAAQISIGGSGQATVWVKNSLSVSVGGSGDVAYYGDPQIQKSLSGSGSVKRLGGVPR